jgi:hypothetical protein
MTEKKAKTATPHLRETPEQRQQIEHEDAIERSSQEGISSEEVLHRTNALCSTADVASEPHGRACVHHGGVALCSTISD